MKIDVICVGRIKEKYLKDAVDEYQKRLSRYVKLEIIELDDEKTPDDASAKEEELIKTKEGNRILKVINDDAYVISLEINANQPDSVALARHIEKLGIEGISHVQFVIGGSLGLSSAVISKADYHLSFSNLTFPHQLMRVILLEQIYRSYRIIKNEPYHK